MSFELISEYTPTGDQPQAIAELSDGIKRGTNEKVLLGVTGSGKTFTVANVIQNTQRPTLIISHNKTLAAQLYREFKSFFPNNAVSYFVSYYDYYQPEAYVPQTDTYIEKETEINEEIDKLRLAVTTNILTRSDVIVVASVSCIYNIGSPKEYGNFILELKPGVVVNREQVMARLIELQYERSEYGFHRSTFRVRGDTIDIFPAYQDIAIRIRIAQKVQSITELDPLTGEEGKPLPFFILYPAKHYMTDVSKQKDSLAKIEDDLNTQVAKFKKAGKLLEAQRLQQKVHYDLEMIQEMGYVNGIENYSRYFDGRKQGDPPYTLFDYFKETYGKDWLLCIDESHMTIPQIRGMYAGDRSRKQTLIEYGFRLPSALDNRPLEFSEFLRRLPQTLYISATPSEWEMNRAYDANSKVVRPKAETIEATKELAKKIQYDVTNNPGVVEQLIRPTGLVDPIVTIRPVKEQILDLTREIEKRVAKQERTLVTTLTKRNAEDLSDYLDEKGFKVHFLHADVLTLERTEILDDLRRGTYDVIVGINLLREGLDLPEVSLVAILDADKEGFLRSDVALIQTMGRAARHLSGEVIMYADVVTGSMKRAIDEVGRRRDIQIAYNKKHGISPKTISKPIRERMSEEFEETDPLITGNWRKEKSWKVFDIKSESLTPLDKKKLIKRLSTEMKLAAEELNFELAAEIRDKVRELKGDLKAS